MLVVSQTHMLRIMEVVVHIIEKCDDTIKSLYSCQMSLLGRCPKVSQVLLGPDSQDGVLCLYIVNL